MDKKIFLFYCCAKSLVSNSKSINILLYCLQDKQNLFLSINFCIVVL